MWKVPVKPHHHLSQRGCAGLQVRAMESQASKTGGSRNCLVEGAGEAPLVARERPEVEQLDLRGIAST